MGVRGEVFSSQVLLKNRSYFFNVKENRFGNLYLNIVESKNKEGSGFERQSIILFEEDLQEFLKGFDSALRVLEKSVKEHKRSAFQANKAQRVDKAQSLENQNKKTVKRIVVKKEKITHHKNNP